jgi:hypothetical protein
LAVNSNEFDLILKRTILADSLAKTEAILTAWINSSLFKKIFVEKDSGTIL